MIKSTLCERYKIGSQDFSEIDDSSTADTSTYDQLATKDDQKNKNLEWLEKGYVSIESYVVEKDHTACGDHHVLEVCPSQERHVYRMTYHVLSRP